MYRDPSLDLICELASWNGRLSGAIEVALISIKHANLTGGFQTLQMVLRDYQEYRDAQYLKVTGQEPTHEDTMRAFVSNNYGSDCP